MAENSVTLWLDRLVGYLYTSKNYDSLTWQPRRTMIFGSKRSFHNITCYNLTQHLQYQCEAKNEYGKRHN